MSQSPISRVHMHLFLFQEAHSISHLYCNSQKVLRCYLWAGTVPTTPRHQGVHAMEGSCSTQEAQEVAMSHAFHQEHVLWTWMAANKHQLTHATHHTHMHTHTHACTHTHARTHTHAHTHTHTLYYSACIFNYYA